MARKKTTVEEKLAKISFDLVVIEKLSGFGFTDKEIANILDVNESTINRWKQDEIFKGALQRGKDKADARVIESLYNRATGYDVEDIHLSSYQGTITKTKYKKKVEPHVTAIIYWLNNRRKKDWKFRQAEENTGLTADELMQLKELACTEMKEYV